MSTFSLQPELDNALSGGGNMGALIRALDWSKTPLGAAESWPQSLKTSVSICLNSRFPVLIWWGPELVKIYNDAYVQLIGSKHPWALGAEGRAVWPEIWDTIGPLLAGVMERGEANWADDLLLMLERHGYAEECYFTFSYSPIRDESGGIGGVFTPVVETTDKVIGERRLRTLRNLATARSNRSRDAVEACRLAVSWLADNPEDVPFAAVYLLDDDRRTARLASATSGRNELLDFPQTIDLTTAGWLQGNRILAGHPCTFPTLALGLATEPVGAWNSAVEEVAALPILSMQGVGSVGFLLAGISPRKRLDDAYRSFFVQLTDELAQAIRDARMLQREAELVAQSEAERAKIRELFHQAPAAIMMLEGPSHRIVLVNARYVQLVGRETESQLLGKPLAEALPELIGQGFLNLLDQVYYSGNPFVGSEMKAFLQREGSGQQQEGYFNFVYQPTRDGAGAVNGILIHVVEVTEQVLARKEIESREEQFRVLADSIPQMAWMANANGDLFWYNRRWYEYTGSTPIEMMGWGWQSVHDPEMLPSVIERYKESLATGEPFNMTFPLRGADGNFRDFLTLALPVRDTSGRIVRWFGTNTDMEAQRKTEQALRQSEKLAAVGRLASSIAHEINNPLEAVINLIYLAKTSATEADLKYYLESAEGELQRVAQITAQTLRFHKQPTAPTPADIPDVLASILTLFRSRLSREEMHLKVEIGKCSPLVCYAGELRQVLANLVGNALDAMPQGGTLRLRVRECTCWQTGRPGVRITVADTGHGMSPDTMKRLYQPFFTTKEAVGTGLGLWVSVGIAEKHGGHLRVRSTDCPGHSGTTFSLFLPHNGCLQTPITHHQSSSS